MTEKSVFYTEKRKICRVPGCRGTTSQWPLAEAWICRPHWTPIPLSTRQRHQRLQRRADRDPGFAAVSVVERQRAWEACLDAAVSAA